MDQAFGIAVAENAIGNVAGSLGDQFLNLIFNPVIVVRKCNENVENLKKEVEKLKNERDSVKLYIEEVGRRGEETVPKLQTWLNRADDFIKVADKLLGVGQQNANNKCFFRLCPNPLSQYKLSKKAGLNSLEIGEHVKAASGFDLPMSCAPPTQHDTAALVEGFEEFRSRMAVLDQIMEALSSPIVNTIGVHGTSGVGKTMLVKEVKRKAKQDSLFTAVVMAKVTKNPELKSIQEDIARDLGMDQLSHGELTGRQVADRIKARLIKGKKFLVILDDVWETGIALEEIGIPSASEVKQPTDRKNEKGSSREEDHMTCKILLISRERDVLLCNMGSKDQVFELCKLETNESWELFRKTVGNNVERPDLQPLAKEIVEKCLGLPVAIVSVGNALKGKTQQYEWKDALQQLKKPSPKGISAAIYKPIELNYNNLEEEELKLTFILCSLMGHDSSVDDLLKYGMGLDLFQMVNTMEETRARVQTWVSRLKLLSLLVDGHTSMQFDMHDQIREVALSIAFRDHGVLALVDEVARNRWKEKETLEKLKWISLPNGDTKLPADGLKCPQLAFFHLSNKGQSLEVPSEFLKRTEGLKVLSLTKINFESTVIPLQIPINLRTLLLDQCAFRGKELGALMGNLENLEVLSLMGCDIEELPGEIGKLAELKLLDLSDCTKLRVIPRKVLASLSRLEELKMGNSFNRWNMGEGNASLDELIELHKLTALEVGIPDFQMIPRGLFSEKLERFKIFIGGMLGYLWDSSFESSRRLKLKLSTRISFNHSIRKLIKKTDDLHLEELNGVKDVVNELDTEGFRELKYLQVKNASHTQHIIDFVEPHNAFPILEVLVLCNLENMEKICNGPLGAASFSKLRMITVELCNQLKSVFSSSIARQLFLLQEITITNCRNMTQIVGDDEPGNENEIAEASEGVEPEFGEVVRSLRLQHLESLITFNGSCSSRTLFNEQVLPKLEELQLSWINVHTIWQASITSSSVENLTKLIIQGCHNLEYIFSFCMVRCLVKLGHLEIRECKMMREIIDMEEEKDNLIFPLMSFLLMKNLQNLLGFYLGKCAIEFPSLKQLEIRNCPEFKEFTLKSISTDVTTNIQPLFNEQVAFPSLERMAISHLKNLTTIWHDQLHENSFCKLKSLEVTCCEKLMNILPSNNMLASFWTSLEELRIYDCGSLEAVFKLGEINGNQRSVVIDTRLKVLDIESLTRLKHVWSKDPEGILSFQNLESVRVSCCNSLDHLFPASVGKNLLQLQTLDISNSGLEEIIAMGGGTKAAVKFEFPLLSSLSLDGLPRLKYFYPGKHSTEWPMLKEFQFFDCGQTKKTNGQGQLDFPVQQPLFSVEKIIPQLEELSLTEDDILMICGESKFKENLFFNIKLLQIRGYLDESAVLPIRFLYRFSNLEKLVLKNSYFTELFPSNRELVGEQEKQAEILSRIKILKLHCLHELKHILSQDSSTALQNLQTLEVWHCNSLPCLSTSKTASFHNLTTLNVWQCHYCMITLVSVPMARSLLQLEHMTIEECDNLTKIVGCEGDGTEDSVINFNKLRFLKLDCLPRLESFCSGNFTFNFPSLEKVIVDECPKLKIFCKKDLSTPLLQRVELIEGEDEWRWAGDLNTTIQSMHKEKVGYARLRDLILSDFSELIEIWHVKRRPQEILDFRQLKFLELYNCSKLTYLLTPSMVFNLVRLEFIRINNCAMMEQVIMGDGEESKMIFPLLWNIQLESCSNLISFYVGNHSLEISYLNIILIEDCPKMVTFAASTLSKEQEKETSYQYFFNSKVEIPVLEELTLSSINRRQIWPCELTSVCSFVRNLRVLIVTDCGNLRHLFTSSMVEVFTQLKKLEIRRCKVVDVVILIEGLEEEERMIQEMFPKLETLVLSDLPQLIRFCSNGDSQLGEISEPQGLNASGSQLEPVIQSTLGHTEATKLVFPQVKYLTLWCLQKFKSFFPQMHITEWPSLKRMYVYGCNEVQLFASGRKNRLESGTQHPLFWISKDTFPILEVLKLEWNGNMKEIWHGQHPEEYFDKLKVLELTCFLKGSTFLPPFFVQSLPNLEKLVVTDAILNEVFQCEEVGVEEKPYVCRRTSLCELRLSRLHELTHLWKEESQIEPILNGLKTLEVKECSRLKNLVPSMVYFNNLQTLEVSKCLGLANLVRYSTAKSLGRLTRMRISECDMINEIVACVDDEVKDAIVFSQLKYLHLFSLPRLGSFCSMECIFEFPSLEEVIVEMCPRMKIFSVGEVRTSLLKRVQFTKRKDTWRWEGNLNTTIKKLFTEKVVYSGLENLNLPGDYDLLVKTWSQNPQEILDFGKLKCLEISFCCSLKYLLTPSMVSNLVQLEDLKVEYCEQMEQVIMVKEDEEGLETTLIFPRLNSILLESCTNMTCFCAATYPVKFPSVLKFIIDNCPKMVTFASPFSRDQEKEAGDGESEEKIEKEELDIPIEPFLCDKVCFAVLESLKLYSLNIQQIWHSQLLAMSSFVENLTELTVEGCCNLKYLMTFSMLKSFVQLKTLQIHECKMLEVVMLMDGLEEKEISFRKLESLELFDLPKLKRFYSYCDPLEEVDKPDQGLNGSRSQATQSTLVETIDTKLVFPQVTYLNLSRLPTFQGVQIQHQRFWINQATFPCLEELELEWNDNMKGIWHGQHPEEYFCKLKVLKLLGFPDFLPHFFFQSLPNLEKLAVSDAFFCEIFHWEEAGAEEKPIWGRTPLIELRLSKLHKLTHLWKEESQLELVLNNLTTLEVQECSRLKNLVPSTANFNNLVTLEVSKCHRLVKLVGYSTVKSLVQLTTMRVTECEMIEEIAECLGDDVKDGIIFTNLKYLQLEGLPRLASFCSGICNFEFPALEVVIVDNCPNMQIFTNGELSTPKLVKLKEYSWHEGRWEGSLNCTVQQVFKEKLQNA